MKKVIGIGLITLITSFIWRDAVVFGVFKMHQDFIVKNQCINRNKPITQCHGNCVLTERLVQPLNTSPTSDSDAILIEIKMEFVVDEKEDKAVFYNEIKHSLPFIINKELKGYLPALIKPPETV